MAQAKPVSKQKMLIKTGLWAACSAGLYAVLFANEATVTQYFTKGSFYAALPIATAFAFSIVHGAFASQFLEALGINARKQPAIRVDAVKQKEKAIRPDQRPRLSVK